MPSLFRPLAEPELGTIDENEGEETASENEAEGDDPESYHEGPALPVDELDASRRLRAESGIFTNTTGPMSQSPSLEELPPNAFLYHADSLLDLNHQDTVRSLGQGSSSQSRRPSVIVRSFSNIGLATSTAAAAVALPLESRKRGLQEENEGGKVVSQPEAKSSRFQVITSSQADGSSESE